jgi:hypothetical protein
MPLVLLLIGAGCASEQTLVPADPDLADLAFLTGAWVTEIEDGVRTEELWTTPDGGMMLGVNRTVAIGEDEQTGRRTVAFEFLRIEHTGDDEIIYYAAPEGRSPATPFRLTDRSPMHLVFSNPDHDYPRRIIYAQQDDGSLLVRIEGVEDGREKSSRWILRRARLLSGLTEFERDRIERERWHMRQTQRDSMMMRRGTGSYPY